MVRELVSILTMRPVVEIKVCDGALLNLSDALAAIDASKTTTTNKIRFITRNSIRRPGTADLKSY